MQHHLVANRNALTDNQLKTWISVQHRCILHITIFTDFDEVVIASHYYVRPDTGVLVHAYLTDHFCAFGNPSSLIQMRGHSV